MDFIKSQALLHRADNEKALCLLSGGIDSTVALYLAKHCDFETIGLQYDYEGRPKAERERVQTICERASVPLYSVHYPVAQSSGESELVTPEKRVLTLKESNSFYFLTAGNLASRLNATTIIGGQIKDDWTDFEAPEAEIEFYDRLNRVLQQEYGKSAPKIVVPFIDLTKEQVVRLGKELCAPLELTWSCSKSQETEPCATCYQCKSREEAISTVFGSKCHERK